jgi:hypothetical protein
MRHHNYLKNSILLKHHEILNFKGIKPLSFPNFIKLGYKFKWGSTLDLMTEKYFEKTARAIFFTQYSTDALEYFYSNKHKIFPIVFRMEDKRLDKKFISDLFFYLNPPTNSVQRMYETYAEKDLCLDNIIILIEDDIIIQYEAHDLIIFINPNKHLETSNDNPLYLLLRLIAKYKIKRVNKNQINIVYKSDYGFDKMAFDVKRVNINIDENYNDDFKEVSEYIIKNLNNRSSGLYILNGILGAGKTMFIRYLTSRVKRNIIFVSPDMVEYITDPGFIPFLMENNNSILIIEDAETVLRKREVGHAGTISSILNITDGLLSDCLNISIIATFNTDLKTLDDALLRHGRLVKSYTFEKLNAEKSTNLLHKLGKIDKELEVIKPMTLAEIYFYGENNEGNIPKRKIGFRDEDQSIVLQKIKK